MSRFLSHTACLESPLSVSNETVIDMTAILGYARVSTTGQDLDTQLAASSLPVSTLTGCSPTSSPDLRKPSDQG